MEIIVEGKGIKYFTPDQVIMNFNFITKNNNYEEVLELGSKNVEIFIIDLLEKNGFTNKDLKTKNFVIREETKYNEQTRKYEFDGYSFNQSATLKFCYDKEKMSKIMDEISKLSNPPKYQINFGLKNEEESKKEIIKEAYQDAQNKANEIAEAAGLKLKECVKVDFKPFTTTYISESNFGSNMMYSKANLNPAEVISKTFTPEDIELIETLYCLWLAE